jgi:diguanylate cyclase (GGDEF)-like protein/putative nucleotidyltransferase with HDIG domain
MPIHARVASSSATPSYGALSRPGRAFLPVVILGAAALWLAASLLGSPVRFNLPLFLGAACLCAGTSSLEFVGARHFSHQPNLIVFFAASALLPPWALAPLALLCFGPGWSARRPPWFMAAFNVANYVVAGIAAHEVVRLDANFGAVPAIDINAVVVLAGAVVAFVVVNHLLIALAVVGGRGGGPRPKLREHLSALPLDIGLAACGACVAALWYAQRPLTLLVLGPILLVYSALSVPALRHKSRTDPKTGLLNSERLREVLGEEIAGGVRRGRPVAVVMLDLDHLRQANNRFGHLAGDQLIRGVADVLAEEAGTTGMAARFGGEEFCVVLPGRDLHEAEDCAERIRARVQASVWNLRDGGQELRLTISAGIAVLPEHGDSVDALLAAADAAVYDAKLGGRNRVRVALPPGARVALQQPAPSELRAAAAPTAAPDDASAADAALLFGADLHAVEPEPAVAPAAPASKPASSRLVLPLLGVLVAALVLVLAVSSTAPIATRPLLFGLLIAAVVLLDLVPIDIFERAHTSPGAVFTLALAFLFGAPGPLAAEAIAALPWLRAPNRSLRVVFDLVALGLAGAAAATTWQLLAGHSAGSLLVAGAASGFGYYLVNMVLLSVVMGLSEGQAPIAAWRERLAWLWPHYLGYGFLGGMFVLAERYLGAITLLLFVFPVLMLWVAQRQYVARSRTSVAELRRNAAELEGANERLRGLLADNQRLLGRMHRSYLSTITSLARTIEAKDPYTGGHTERVANIATVLAAELGFDESSVRAVNVGAVIHDIGKIGVPDSILLKRGGLTPDERSEIERHPEISSYIVADLELPAEVKQMVRSHHERYDGGGYPDGMAGEEIPLAARILTVADSLDAMISDRPYRKALTVDVALTEIERHTGTQFCPRVVAALRRCISRDPALVVEVHEDLGPWTTVHPRPANGERSGAPTEMPQAAPAAVAAASPPPS